MPDISLDELLGRNYSPLGRASPIAVKFGTGCWSTTESPFSIHAPYVEQSANTIAWLKQQEKRQFVVIISGAVVKGQEIVRLKTRPEDIGDRQYLSSKGQAPLVQMFSDALKRYEIVAAQALMEYAHMATEAGRANVLGQFRRSFEDPYGVYVINANDFANNEALLEEFRLQFPQAADYRLTTDNDGLAVRIAEVMPAQACVMVSRPGFPEVGSGSGFSKMNAASYAVENGVMVQIVHPDSLDDALAGKDVGSKYLPDRWGTEMSLPRIGMGAYVTQAFIEGARSLNPRNIVKGGRLLTFDFDERGRHDEELAVGEAHYSITLDKNSVFFKLELQSLTRF